MPDRTSTPEPRDAASDTASGRIIEIPQKEASIPGPSKEVSLAEVKKSRTGLLQGLGRLRPLLPILSGGLRMIDHGAVQALAQLLSLAGSGGSQSAAAREEMQRELDEIGKDYRNLHHQAQDQAVEMQRIRDQVTLLQQAVERNTARNADLAKSVRSLGHLVRAASIGLGILLVVLITLAAVLLAHRH